jgi:glycosyltransferase involved in cell wall biosynthesis
MRVGVDGRSLGGAGRGVAAYAAGMIAALAADGVDVRVLAPRGAQVDGGDVVALPVPSRLVHGAAALVRRPRLDRLVGPVDVVWLPAPAPVAIGPTPYAVTFHDLSFLERPGDYTAYARLWHRLARPAVLARRAARVVANTYDTAERVRARFGVDPVVVPAGPGDPGPASSPDTRFGRYFLFVGALEPRKGLEVLTAAHRGLEPALVLAGDGPLARRLRGAGVHVLGRVSQTEKAALYAGALAVVLPSWCEGYGYPPLEGFAHGTPAIVSDLPALRETAGDGARHVPPGDVQALAAAMRELAGDAALRDRLAEAGRATLADRAWDTSARRLRAVLEAAAGA